ncbi:hypothetical protein Ddc_03310 [Ditylenchus destructor]|nr:hypothetical protein Ddc_03310 [Ditylenchus destructor]
MASRRTSQDDWCKFFVEYCEFNDERAKEFAKAFFADSMQLSSLTVIAKDEVSPNWSLKTFVVLNVSAPKMGEILSIIAGAKEYVAHKRPLTPMDAIPGSQPSPPRPLTRKEEGIVRYGSQYLLLTEGDDCVTVLTKRFAATYRHIDHKKWEINQKIQLKTLAHFEARSFKTVVIGIYEENDFILLDCEEENLCEEEPHIVLPWQGAEYTLLGLSNLEVHGKFSIRHGRISSREVTPKNHLLGDSGSRPGDSGGPLFHSQDGTLFGMNVSCDGTEILVLRDETTYQEIRNNFSSRFPSRCHFVPATLMKAMAEDWLNRRG